MPAKETPQVIVADDDPDLLNLLEYQLTCWGYRVHCAQHVKQLFEFLGHISPDAIILDLHYGNEDGAKVCAELVQRPHACPVIILTGYGSISSAVATAKVGVYDYLTKPTDMEVVKATLAQAVEHHRFRQRLAYLDRPAPHDRAADAMIGDTPAIRQVRRMIDEVAPTDAKVLIMGESGTGKELVAQAIHAQSLRRERPLVAVNMAALPRDLAESILFGHEKGAFSGAETMRKGWCENADAGTLFLDEIGEMDLYLQAKLLRFLQDQTFQRVGSSQSQSVDVRIISATNGDPEALVRDGKLREDLYHRLNVFPIAVPPLRERRDDIPLLAAWFAKKLSKRANKPEFGFTDAAIELLVQYDWPGNVRELENMVERVLIRAESPLIGPAALPEQIRKHDRAASGSSSYEPWLRHEPGGLRTIDRIEKQVILDALGKTDGNVVDAARLLGIGQATLYRKIKRYGIALKRPRRVGVTHSTS